jgi:hypothetical protein
MALDRGIEATPTEQEILQEINRVSGLDLKIGGINTRDKATADAVLPVLVHRAVNMDDASHSRAVYSRFQTRHARPYFETLMVSESGPEQGTHVLYSQFAIAEDLAQKSWPDCFARVNRYHGSSPVGMGQEVMAAADASHIKASPPQGCD